MLCTTSLRSRIALSIALAFVAFAITVRYATFMFFEHQYITLIYQQQFSLASSLAHSIDNKLKLAQTALSGGTRGLTAAIAADPAQAQKYLDSRPSLQALFDDGIFLVGIDGRLIAEAPQLPLQQPGAPRFSREICAKTLETGKPQISKHSRSFHNPGNPAVFLTVPVFDAEGRIYALLGGSIDLYGKNLLEEMAHIRIGKTGYLYVCDQDRTIIIHPDKSRILTRAAKGLNPLLERAFAGFEGSGRTVSTVGMPLLTSFKHLSSNDWIIAVNLPVEEAFAPLRKARLNFTLATIGGTAGILLLAWFMLKKPANAMKAIARHLAAVPGKSGAQKFIPITSGDEIGILAKAYNEMVAELDKKQEALQESEDNFRALAETATDGMLVITKKGSFAYTNYRAARMLGYSVSELLNCCISDLAPPAELPDLLERFQQVIEWKRVPKHFETRLVRKDGEMVSVELTNSLTIWQGDSAALVMIRDISERRRIEKALQDSHTLLQKTFSSLNESVFIVQKGTRIIRDCNITAERMFGYGREEMIGATISCLHVNDELSDRFGSEMLRSYESKGFFETTLKMKRKDGTLFDCDHYVTPMREEDEIVSHVYVVRDISERKRAEEALHAAMIKAENEKARTEAIIAAIGEGVIILDREHKILYQNEFHKALIGDHQGDYCYRAYDREHAVCGDCPAEMAYADGKVHSVDKTWWSKGKLVHLEVTASPLRDASGEIIAGIELVRDVTERKQAEEEIKKLNAELQQHVAEVAAANKDLEAFGYSLSHDLKGPLTSIFCAADALLDLCADKLDDTGNFFLDGICKASERMNEIINAIALLSRVSQSDLEQEKIDVSDLANQILLKYRMEDQQRNLETAIAPGITVTADLPLLKSALENLLGNAWKYTRNTPDAVIELGTFRQGSEEVLFVRDNGAGFDMKHADKLFKPFQRLHSAREFEGTGVGLATVQRIIERHGGRLWGVGEPGNGATFYFTLPECDAQHQPPAPG